MKAAPVTVVVLAICVAVFIAAETTTGSTTRPETLVAWGATWRPLVWKGEWWRLFTAMFLHIGVVHLVWNAWAGWGLCSAVEQRLGSPRYLAVYLFSGVAGSAASVIGHSVVAAGASGAMFGAIGALFVTDRLVLGSWRAVWERQSRALVLVAAWLLMGPFVGFDNWAHGGGLLAGLAATWAILRRSPLSIAAAVAVALVIPASLFPW